MFSLPNNTSTLQFYITAYIAETTEVQDQTPDPHTALQDSTDHCRDDRSSRYQTPDQHTALPETTEVPDQTPDPHKVQFLSVLFTQ